MLRRNKPRGYGSATRYVAVHATARAMYVGLSYVESMTTFDSGTFCRSFSSVESPSPSGMRMSRRITSGLNFCACFSDYLPFSASPTISISLP